MSDANSTLTIDRLRELLHYEPETGKFTRLVSVSSGARSGSEAGCTNRKGYRQVVIDKRLYLCHRLAFFYMLGAWPEQEVDHINSIKSDNRWANLRDVSRLINSQNLRATYGKSGFLGVFKHRRRYRASIRAEGKTMVLGLFATAEEAYDAYLQAKRRLHEGNTL